MEARGKRTRKAGDAPASSKSPDPLYTLYFAPKTRSLGTRWLLEELGASYKLHTLDFGKKEQKGDEYRKVHPHAQVPALTDHATGVTMIESEAIALYLAEKHGSLYVPIGSPLRAAFLQWCFYGGATMEGALMKVYMHGPASPLPAEERSSKTLAEATERWKEIASFLTKNLDGKKFLVGDELTVADGLIFGQLFWVEMLGLLKDYPVLTAFVASIKERPAWKKATAE